MPRHADQAIIRSNPDIQGLALLLNERQFCTCLQHSLPLAGITGVKRNYIRFKSGMNCLIRYEVTTESGSVTLYAKAYSSDNRVKLDKTERRSSCTGPLGPGRLIWREYGIVVCMIPNDNKLRSLKRIGMPESRSKIVQNAIADSTVFENANWTMLNYKPERRYVAQLAAAGGEKAVIKFYQGDSFDSALLNARWFKKNDDQFFPSLLGYSRRHCLLVSKWVEGELLSDICQHPSADLSAVRQTGEKLAQFHSGQLVQPHHRYATDTRGEQFIEHAQTIGVLLPGLHRDAESLANKIVLTLERLKPELKRIHGDFHPAQVLRTDQGIKLIDLDEVCIGNAEADVGQFLAQISLDCFRGALSVERAADIESMFLEGYRQYTAPASLENIDFFIAVGLFQLSHHPYRYCLQNWPGLIKQLLDKAAGHLEQHFRTSKKNVAMVDLHDAELLFAKIHQDPAFSSTCDALDAAVFGQALSKNCDNFNKICRTEIHPLRHRQGRRCVIEYDVQCSLENGVIINQTLVGKIRARGLDTRTYNLNQALYANGFGPSSTDGIEVPQPVATIRRFAMWLQLHVPGKTAFPLFTGTQGAEFASRIALALHKLHSQSRITSREHRIEDELHILSQQLEKVIDEDQGMKRPLHAILDACRHLAQSIPSFLPAGIHRDFYHDQILIDKQKLYILDLDLFSRGDPAVDVGNFIAHVMEQCLREYGNTNAANDVIDIFAQEYMRLHKKNIQTSIDAYTTLSLVRLIAISRRIAERRVYTGTLIALCERRLELDSGITNKWRTTVCVSQ